MAQQWQYIQALGQEGFNNIWKTGSWESGSWSVVRGLRCERNHGVAVNRPSKGKKVSYNRIGIMFQVRLPNGNVQLRQNGNSGTKDIWEQRFRAEKVMNKSGMRVVTREWKLTGQQHRGNRDNWRLCRNGNKGWWNGSRQRKGRWKIASQRKKW